MPDEHVPVLQSMGAAIFLLIAALWVFGVYALARRGGLFGPVPRLTGRRGPQAPSRRRRSAPHLESVELTPAERAAFAGLVRQLSDGR